jgi:hypothetical protein
MIGLAEALAGMSLLAGFCTPAAAAIVGVGAVGTAFSWLGAPKASPFDTLLTGILVGVIARRDYFSRSRRDIRGCPVIRAPGNSDSSRSTVAQNLIQYHEGGTSGPYHLVMAR